jgi:hypothetical protein
MRRSGAAAAALLLIAVMLFAAGCSGLQSGGGGSRETVTDVKMPEASGSVVYKSGSSAVDASNADDGYVMIKYTGSADRIQVQVTNPDGSRNPYPAQKGKYIAFPLTEGKGRYKIEVLAHLSGDKYAVDIAQTIDARVKNDRTAFTYPNQYVQYDSDSRAVKYSRKLSEKSSSDEEFITKVFNYVTDNIKYDDDFAKNIPVNYIPSPDRTMKTKKGICLDYASLMTAMLRSQGIPTKLEVGYAGDVYHAWISVYVKDKGWIDDIIELEGDKWTLVDPTLAASNGRKESAEYMKDKSNYDLMYNY